jgi:ubiquinone/menaquinone biosynthesis C-methylase UbiE
MVDRKGRVCPVELAGGLDNRVRRWFQNPQRILSPYIREGMTVLDLGCGPGFFTTDIARMVGPNGRVIAADLQEGMLQKLRLKLHGSALGSRVTLHQCQEKDMRLSQPVDFALAFYMVHELPDQSSFFTGIWAVLNPRGQILVVEPPFHVSKQGFEAMVHIAQSVGFAVAERPHVLLSKAVLLRKG